MSSLKKSSPLKALKNAITMLMPVTMNMSRQAWKNWVLGSANLIMVITEKMAAPEEINEIKEKILKILNFLTSSRGAENTIKANNLLNMRFLNLWEMKMPIKVEKVL